jgi:hypothetical protein
MHKRLTLVLVLVLLGAMVFAAGDWRYVFWNLDQHPEILGGFFQPRSAWAPVGTGFTSSLTAARRSKCLPVAGTTNARCGRIPPMAFRWKRIQIL